MFDFFKVAASTPKIKVADVEYNSQRILECMKEASDNGAGLIVFPELSITGYTCQDLFLQDSLINGAKKALLDIRDESEDINIIAVVGVPLMVNTKLYNCAAVIYKGEILGVVPKSYIPNYSEFYEKRHFTSGIDVEADLIIDDEYVDFGTNLLFSVVGTKLKFGIEICEDLWVPNPPSTRLSLAGALLNVNLSASDENTGKDIYRRDLIKNQSARTLSAYVYADAGLGESTTDLVFSGHNLIVENGTVLKESERFKNQTIYADIDLGRLISERRRINTFEIDDDGIEEVEIEFEENDNYSFNRYVDKAPFVPSNQDERQKRCQEILNIQAYGLVKRLEHTGCKCAVVGVSGGLASTLALLVTVRAFDILNIPRENILAVTMPGFGTTDRTYTNAVTLIKSLKATFREINISEAVKLHFNDIEHNIDIHDITYENAQARQRTYLLMDLANEYNGMVIGTGDMSEMALGWATYNGDHMSMYGVNSGVPKTLVRHLVSYYADTTDKEIADILRDILDTPVSPELLPPKDGVISQKTENLVGPYSLHDFFLYYVLRFGYEPDKILYLAKIAFKGEFNESVIKSWLKTFYRRFFAQQFKRSCMPDGPKVGSVALSPRGDLRMPSDAVGKLWLDKIENL